MVSSFMRTAPIFALVVLLGLSACGNKPEDAARDLQENIVTEMPVDENIPANDDAAAPAPAPENVTMPAAPPPAFSDTQQMRDDADATGLTARLPTDEAPAPVANETQPAQ